MSQSFPTSVPSYPDTTTGEVLGSAGGGLGLSRILDDYGLDIMAISTKIGTGSATPTVNKVLVGSGTGTSTWSSTLSGLTLTSPVISTISNTGTLTLPTSTDTLVGRATTDTLTNKTIAGGSNTISGITEAMQSTSDNTTNDVSTSKHGYAPKAPNDTSQFLRGDATWANTGYYIPILSSAAAGINPTDSTTYYSGSSFSAATVASTIIDSHRIYIPRSGVIKAVYLFVYVGGTLASNENVSHYIRVNDTTDATITTTAQWTAVRNFFSNTSMSQAVSTGDWVTLKTVTPAWATNPTTVITISGSIWVA